MDRRVNFPTECLCYILPQLSGKDLLKCTLVHPEWNHLISSTSRLMDKILFHTGESGTLNETILAHELIECRKYQNIVIHDNLFVESAVFMGIKLSKRIKMNYFSLPATVFRNFLDLVRKNTEELVLNSIELRCDYSDSTARTSNIYFSPEDETEMFTFDKLETLKITSQLQNFNILFIHAPKLKLLHLSSVKIQPPYLTESIHTFLHQLPELRDLRISGKWFKKIFCNFNQPFPFQLEALSLLKSGAPTDFLHYEKKFMKFLATQSRIRKFELNERVGIETMQMIFGMESVRELTIQDCSYSTWIQLRSSGARLHCLEFLDIVTLDCNCEERIKTVLSLFPGLKYLRMRSMRSGIAEFIQGNLKQIEKIQLVHRREAHVDEVLPGVTWLN